MKFTILKKMWLGFSAVLFLSLIVSIIGIWSLLNITNQYKDIIHIDMEKVEQAKSLQNVQKETGTLLLEYIMFGREETVGQIEDKIEERAIVAQALTSLTKDDASLQLLKDLEEQTTLLFESNAKIIELKRDGGNFRPYSAQSSQINAKVLAFLDELITLQEQSSAKTLADLKAVEKFTLRVVVSIAFFSIVIGVIIAFIIGRNIATPVKKVTAGLEEIANGNLLAEPIRIKNKDEIGVMALTYNKMLSDLQTIVTSVHDSSNQLAANAEELSASAHEGLASSQKVADISELQMTMSTQQGQYVDSSARAMQELGTSIHEIASDNESMLNATSDVQTLISKGSSVVSNVANQMNMIHTTFKETTEIMDEMTKHSDEIQKVTALITGISEQTNLLALNAAIEAARAGEYGKGFAVVAEEVRKLAEQSKTSAGEIESIVQLIQSASNNAVSAITNGGEKVAEGLTKTAESIGVFNEIETSVGNVVEKVQSVSAAIEQVQAMTGSVVDNTSNIQALAQNVVTNAKDASAATEEQLASTTEISANAQNLAELAEKLQSKVTHFKI